MGAELPHVPGGDDVVLYPASLRASTDLQDSLTGSGFSVKRINTYDTVSGMACTLPVGSGEFVILLWGSAVGLGGH